MFWFKLLVNMAKKQKPEIIHQKVTVWLGYLLFVIMIIAVILSVVIPWSQILLQPYTRHWNVAVLLVTLVAGAILPVLIAYFIGDKTTRDKNKLMHHYNGILFGILAFWIAPLLSFVDSGLIYHLRMSNIHDVVVSVITLWPVLVTVIILTVLAVAHSRSHKNGSVLIYKPYQYLLLAAIVLSSTVPTFLYPPTSKDDYLRTAISIVAPAVFIAISYGVLRIKKTVVRMRSLMLATVGVSMGFVTINVVVQALPNAPLVSDPINIISRGLSALAGILIWVYCLWSARRIN